MFRRNAPLAKAFVGTLLATLLSLLINVASNDVLAVKRWNTWAIWPLILLLVVLSLLLEGKRQRRLSQPDDPSASERDLTPDLEASYRKHLIVRVRSSWVTDVLGRSLGAAARTAAGSRHSVALDRPLTPWNLVQVQRGMTEAIPADIPVVEVFDRRIGGAMLILGGPGAGKTTLLLRLARDLLDSAEVDPARPVPVVFKLTSWSPSYSLDDWLIDQLRKVYDVPSNLGRLWVVTEKVMPLLDGLDEVPPQDRTRCVEAINAYRDRHGMIQLAITSRSTAYEQVGRRLRVQGIIRVDPPTPPQIAAYLDELGVEVPYLRAALHDDPSLQQLLASPLALSVVALAYRRRSGEDLVSSDTPDAWLHHLFRVYVEEMLGRDDPPAGRTTAWYARENAERYLAWLARALRRHPQGTFRLEWIQPQWLSTRAARFAATWGLTLASALLAMTIAGAVAYVIYEMLNPRLGLPKRQPLLGVPPWLVAAVGVGAAVGIFMHGKTVRPVDELRWSWPALRGRLAGRMPMGVLLGVVAGLVAWSQGDIPQRGGGGVVGMATALLTLVLFITIGGFTGAMREETASPNDGMRRTRQTAMLASIPFALPFGLLTAVLYGAAFNPVVGLVTGLHSTVPFWIVAGLWAGGRDYLRHLTVRALLWRAGLAPWHYARFLNYAASCLLLQQVGPGYQFMHPLLLDHFAQGNDRAVRSEPPHRLRMIGRRLARSFRVVASDDATPLVRTG
jgi:hypothetical protein